MKLMIIRHGDPDYAKDYLTERGLKEREALTKYMLKQDVKAYYVSSMGRAMATIAPTLEAKGIPMETYDWLREFAFPVSEEHWDEEAMKGPWREKYFPWDRLPSVWTKYEDAYGRDSWRSSRGFCAPELLERYDYVIENFDKVLASYGYVRDGLTYRAEAANNDTLAFVCHFGLESVLLSHLLNISPAVLMQNTCARPTSVTTLVTEEREEGMAIFRMVEFGGTSHLYAEGLEPSESGLFRECYKNDWQRP